MATTVNLRDGTVQVDPDVLSIYQENFYYAGLVGHRDDPIKPMGQNVFYKFVEFSNHYRQLDATSKKYFDDLETLYGTKLRGNQNAIKSWCDNFLKNLSVDELMEFINYAKLSGNKIVETLSVIPISNDMSDLNPEEFRKKYKLVSDLTADDVAQLNMEESIWNSISGT